MMEPLEIRFGQGGNSAAFQGTGWAIREDRGTWMIGDESTLIVPRPAQRGDYLLELEIEALVAAGLHDFQRLSIRVNGVGVCNQVLAGNATVQCWLPWSVLGPPLKSMVILSHPDGWRPSEVTGGEGDQRVVSVYVRSARLSLLTARAWEADHVAPENDAELEAIITQQQSQDGHAMRALVEDFDSLGSNCELGMVQRHYGAEPLGLFRFSYTPLDGLLAMLEGDLDPARFAERVSLVLNPGTREYELVDREHGFEWHSWQYEGQADPVVLERQEKVRLPYLVRRFQEMLEDGEKILVLRDEEGPTDPARNGPHTANSIVLRDPSSTTDHRRHPATEAGLACIGVDTVLAAALALLQARK